MKHLKENNETYISHLKFATGIGVGFLYRSVFFIIHGFVPCTEIPKQFNFDATLKWLEKKRKYTLDREA